MDTPFTKAARRGWAFIPVPITLARISPDPKLSAYFRAIGPITDADPASANPNPSRIDFLPSSTTSGGMSSYFVLAINSETDLVSPGAFRNSAAGAGEASTRPLVSASADTASEFLNRSRRFMSHVLVSFLDSDLRGRSGRCNSDVRKRQSRRTFPRQSFHCGTSIFLIDRVQARFPFMRFCPWSASERKRFLPHSAQ